MPQSCTSTRELLARNVRFSLQPGTCSPAQWIIGSRYGAPNRGGGRSVVQQSANIIQKRGHPPPLPGECTTSEMIRAAEIAEAGSDESHLSGA